MPKSKATRVAVAGLLLVLAGFLGVAAYRFSQLADDRAPANSGVPERAALPGQDRIYGTVPEFSLVERSERPVRLPDLRGKVWIANFFYTQCTDTCPTQTANMAALQNDFAREPDVRFVSISVDPEHDTPEFLRDYAKRYDADPERWLFLTGAKDEIERLAIKGFLLGVVERPFETAHVHSDGTVHIHKTAAGERVMHSSRFVLVDRQARIRGYFRANDAESLQHLRPALKRLLAER
jgi:protein SCO1/2